MEGFGEKHQKRSTHAKQTSVIRALQIPKHQARRPQSPKHHATHNAKTGRQTPTPYPSFPVMSMTCCQCLGMMLGLGYGAADKRVQGVGKSGVYTCVYTHTHMYVRERERDVCIYIYVY